MQQASYLDGGPLMWMLPLYLHIIQKSDDDDDDDDDDDKVLQSLNEINASLQKLLSRNEQQKLSKKGHNSAKIWRMITNIELDLYL